jgi:hypothetical protein
MILRAYFVTQRAKMMTLENMGRPEVLMLWISIIVLVVIQLALGIGKWVFLVVCFKPVRSVYRLVTRFLERGRRSASAVTGRGKS